MTRKDKKRVLIPIEKRLWTKVMFPEKVGIDLCWYWTGYRNSDGYGRIKINGRVRCVSHIVYELCIGPIPEGLQVLHKCDNPPCCNPDHLFLGTHQDNMTDMKEKGRSRGTPGEKNTHAVLKETDIPIIRHLWDTKQMTQTALASVYGVSQPMIGYIVRRECWMHVPEENY